MLTITPQIPFNDLQNITHKTKDQVTRTSLKQMFVDIIELRTYDTMAQGKKTNIALQNTS